MENVLKSSGLTDKRGVEIYEGDIIRFCTSVYEVFCDQGKFYIRSAGYEEGLNLRADLRNYTHAWVVVGNIRQPYGVLTSNQEDSK